MPKTAAEVGLPTAAEGRGMLMKTMRNIDVHRGNRRPPIGRLLDVSGRPATLDSELRHAAHRHDLQVRTVAEEKADAAH